MANSAELLLGRSQVERPMATDWWTDNRASAFLEGGSSVGAEAVPLTHHAAENFRERGVHVVGTVSLVRQRPVRRARSTSAQSPSPGLAEKYLSNFPVSSQ